MAIMERSEKMQGEYQKQLSVLKARKMELSEMEALKSHPAWKVFKETQERAVKNYEAKIHNVLAAPPEESYPNQARELHAAKSAIQTVIDCVENPGEILHNLDARIAEVKDFMKKSEDEN